MSIIDRDTVTRQIREAVDIVDLVGGYVALKRAGNRFKGLCPFHQEKTPSFTVDSARQFFKCFGCGAGGDVFNFVRLSDGGIERLDNYLCFAFWRLAAIVEGAYVLYRKGLVNDAYARGLEHDVPRLLDEAAIAAGLRH